MRRAVGLLGLLSLSIGCASSAPRPPTLSVRAIEWNPTHASLGKIRAVVDQTNDVYVFADDAVTLLAAGAVVPIDRAPRRWVSATTLPAPDGNGSWIVGLDGDGKIRRVRARSSLEVVSERWGLGKTRVSSLVSLGSGRIGFALVEQLAISDEHALYRYAYPFSAIVGGGGRAASLVGRGIHVVDIGRGVDETFALEGARAIALDDHGRLYVATTHAIYAQTASGELRLRHESAHTIHALAASGWRIWFGDGVHLGTFEGERVALGSDASIADDTALVGSPSGDVWALRDGALARFRATADRTTTWESTIAPIYARVCSGCHGAGGSAGIDLSTAAAWEARRTPLRVRVLEQKTMPPAGHTLTDGERAAIAAWLGP